MIHGLAARKILQELKDGTSYVHGADHKETVGVACRVGEGGGEGGVEVWGCEAMTKFCGC